MLKELRQVTEEYLWAKGVMREADAALSSLRMLKPDRPAVISEEGQWNRLQEKRKTYEQMEREALDRLGEARELERKWRNNLMDAIPERGIWFDVGEYMVGLTWTSGGNVLKLAPRPEHPDELPKLK